MKRNSLLAIAVVLAILGGMVLVGSNFATKTVHDQLAAQKIKFPPKEVLEKDNPALLKYAAAEVDTAQEAKAFSDYIGGHLSKVAGGQTYSEVSAAYQKDKTNEKLEAQRMSLFMGETLRGLLLNAWGWGIIGQIALSASYALFIVSVGLVITAFTLNNSATKTKKPVTKRKAKK